MSFGWTTGEFQSVHLSMPTLCQFFTKKHKYAIPHGKSNRDDFSSAAPTPSQRKHLFEVFPKNKHSITCPEEHETLILDLETSRYLHFFAICQSSKIVPKLRLKIVVQNQDGLKSYNHKQETCKKQIPWTVQDYQIWWKKTTLMMSLSQMYR